MKNLKIGTRLGLGAAILAMLLLALDGMALQQLRNVNSLSKEALKLGRERRVGIHLTGRK